MKTFALLTDFGTDSFYVGAIKGVLAGAAPQVPIVDVTHGIAPHAVAQAGFVLDRVFGWFPPGTVFVVVVDPGVGSDRRGVIVDVDGRTIVGPDNGVAWEAVVRRANARYVVIDDSTIGPRRARARVGSTFHGRDVFAPAAAALALGADATTLGAPTDRIEAPGAFPRLERGDGFIRGRGRFVDAFGNVLSDVSGADLVAVFGERFRDAATVSVAGREVGPIHDFYESRPPDELMAVLDSWDLVEVAANRGRAVDAFAAVPVESLVFEVRRVR
jgi:hypothetical protein